MTEALRQSGEAQPEFDIALLGAAERPGHLDAACQRHYSPAAYLFPKSMF